MKLKVANSTTIKLPKTPEKPEVPEVHGPSVGSEKKASMDTSFDELNTAFEAQNPDDKETELKPGEFLASFSTEELVGNEESPAYKPGLFDLAVEGE